MLSIPTIRDRVVQGALKLILEPIFEADFQPGSFGYPGSSIWREASALDFLVLTSGVCGPQRDAGCLWSCHR